MNSHKTLSDLLEIDLTTGEATNRQTLNDFLKNNLRSGEQPKDIKQYLRILEITLRTRNQPKDFFWS